MLDRLFLRYVKKNYVAFGGASLNYNKIFFLGSQMFFPKNNLECKVTKTYMLSTLHHGWGFGYFVDNITISTFGH